MTRPLAKTLPEDHQHWSGCYMEWPEALGLLPRDAARCGVWIAVEVGPNAPEEWRLIVAEALADYLDGWRLPGFRSGEWPAVEADKNEDGGEWPL